MTISKLLNLLIIIPLAFSLISCETDEMFDDLELQVHLEGGLTVKNVEIPLEDIPDEVFQLTDKTGPGLLIGEIDGKATYDSICAMIEDSVGDCDLPNFVKLDKPRLAISLGKVLTTINDQEKLVDNGLDWLGTLKLTMSIPELDKKLVIELKDTVDLASDGMVFYEKDLPSIIVDGRKPFSQIKITEKHNNGFHYIHNLDSLDAILDMIKEQKTIELRLISTLSKFPPKLDMAPFISLAFGLKMEFLGTEIVEDVSVGAGSYVHLEKAMNESEELQLFYDGYTMAIADSSEEEDDTIKQINDYKELYTQCINPDNSPTNDSQIIVKGITLTNQIDQNINWNLAQAMDVRLIITDVNDVSKTITTFTRGDQSNSTTLQLVPSLDADYDGINDLLKIISEDNNLKKISIFAKIDAMLSNADGLMVKQSNQMISVKLDHEVKFKGELTPACEDAINNLK